MTAEPYTESFPIEAAGGYVVRMTDEGPAIAMIFRRGVWDLPKGKIDPDETPAQCALREVKEEIGAEDLQIIRGAGMTIHKYPEEGRTILKTTWWFIMSTTSTTFEPEAREQIERVEWVPWADAQRVAGFENLRRHMRLIDDVIRGLDREMA